MRDVDVMDRHAIYVIAAQARHRRRRHRRATKMVLLVRYDSLFVCGRPVAYAGGALPFNRPSRPCPLAARVANVGGLTWPVDGEHAGEP